MLKSIASKILGVAKPASKLALAHTTITAGGRALTSRPNDAFLPYIAKDRTFEELVFDFHIANEVGQQWYDGSPQQFMPERKWCYDRIAPGMTVVDCGAHHGMMTVIFAKRVGPRGHVFAYEALPENADVIRANAALNELNNVVVRPVGVGASDAEVGYDRNASNIVVGAKPTNTDTVSIVALDSDLPADVRVDFLKIDVEGFEVEAMSGMRRILAMRPIIDLEIHNFLSPDRAASLSALASRVAGYRFTVLGEVFGEETDMGKTFDVEYLSQFDNPHVFCEPL